MTKLIVISTDFDFKNEMNQVHALFDAGMELLHLRKPLWDLQRQENFLNQLSKDELSRVSLHQFHETAEKYGITRFHYKEAERNKAIPHKDENPNVIRSTSFHDPATLEKIGPGFNYCFLSPIFKSISKINHVSTIDSDYKVKRKLDTKVFALGGITEERIPQVMERNFYGVAVLGALWNGNSSPVNNFKKLMALCK